jgi:transposase
MYYAGLDVAGKGSFVYVRDKKGIKVESGEIVTTRKGVKSFFDKYVEKKIIVAVEASGSTRWIYDLLTRMGIDVYVVNPNKVKAIADSKRKTDKIDAKILSELLRIDALPERVRMAEGQDRELRDLIQARFQVIKGYTSLMNYLRGLLRQEGVRIPAREFKKSEYVTRLNSQRLPGHVREIVVCYADTISGMLQDKDKLLTFLLVMDTGCPSAVVYPLFPETSVEAKIKEYSTKDIELIKTIPGMGEISSRTIQAAIGDIKRFKHAKQLTSYCGLVPTVYASGERVEYGHITREGRSEVRRVGIQCAHALLRSKAIESQPLRKWWLHIAKRRGVKTALAALARKLVTITFYVLRDQKEYDYTLLRAA